MEGCYIKHPHSNFYYRKFGKGAQLLFCFHGYGRESSTFDFLDTYLTNQFTIIAIDLPFHGLTTWNKELTFHPDYLVQVIQQIRAEQKKLHDKISLLGFSIGGRVALYLTQILHKHIDRLVLIAPDGLNNNFWHSFAAQTWLGNRLMKYTIRHPEWMQTVLRFAEKTGLINNNVAGFIHYHTDTENQRRTLYQRWITMRLFKPKRGKIKMLVREHHIKVRLLFGKYDRIISAAGGWRFCKGIEEYAKLKIIDTGHHLLQRGNALKIAQLFND